MNVYDIDTLKRANHNQKSSLISNPKWKPCSDAPVPDPLDED